MAVQETNKTISEDDSTSDARDKRAAAQKKFRIFISIFEFSSLTILKKRKQFYVNEAKVRKSGLSESLFFSIVVFSVFFIGIA